MKVHIQKHNKAIRRLTAFFAAVLLVATLAVTAFAGLNGVQPSNGYFAIRNKVSGNVTTFKLPDSAPADGNANYVCVICCNPQTNDQYPPVVMYITFNSSNWGLSMVQTIVSTSPTSYYDAYRFSVVDSSMIDSIYFATWANFSDSMVSPEWVESSLSSFISYVDVYAFVSSSKDISSNGVLLFRKNSYINGINGSMSEGAVVDGTLVTPDGTPIISPVVPNVEYVYETVYGGDLYSIAFGLIDGLWSGFFQGYTILADGVAVGGFTLGELVTTVLSVLVVAAILALVFKFKGGGGG